MSGDVDAAEQGEEAYAEPMELLEHLAAGQDALRDGLERLAAAVTPLLTSQYRDTGTRMRVLETRLRNRQERPLIVQMAGLLADVRRLDSAQDIKDHVEDALSRALTGVGYQETGSPGDQFDPEWHEPVSGSVGKSGVVARVHRRGLACYGDVIIKAQVDVRPDPGAETDQGEL